jgi:hypothetical protein
MEDLQDSIHLLLPDQPRIQSVADLQILGFLNSELNGPQYETKAHALATSPVSLCFNDLNSAAFCTHLSLLSPKELMSLLACSIFFLVLFAFSYKAFFSAI